MNDVTSLGANGIIGIGLFKYDCGSTCVNYQTTAYYSCKSGTCTSTKIPLTSQLLNPVAAMPAPYNNGNVTICDPFSLENSKKSWNYSQISSQIKAVWVYSK